jgi:hypothetical protein
LYARALWSRGATARVAAAGERAFLSRELPRRRCCDRRAKPGLVVTLCSRDRRRALPRARRYDIIKKMERMGKSVGMIAGQAEPTVIQPPNYRNRFQAAMERYFMMVPDKWTIFRMRGDQA